MASSIFNGKRLADLVNQNKVTSGGAGALTNFMNSQPKPAYTPGNNTPDNYRVRDYLTDQGYSPKDIGTSGGSVTLKGNYFMPSNPGKDGYNTGTQSALASALKSYRGSEQGNQLNNVNNSYYNAVNEKPAAVTPYTPFEYTQANIEANPIYQSAVATALQNIKTGQNNTLANLAANGQGDSSYAVGVAQQIANKEMGNVDNNLLPQLIQQAYQRHLDTFNNNNLVEDQAYGRQQDRIGNLSGLGGYLSGLQQQDYNNAQNERQSRINEAANLSAVTGKLIHPQLDSSGLYRQAADPNTPFTQSGQINNQTIDSNKLANAWDTADKLGYVTKELSALTGIPEGTRTLDAIQTYNNMANDNKRTAQTAERSGSSVTSPSISQLIDIWRASGVAPPGIPNVNPGTPYGGAEAQQPPQEKPLTYEDAYKDIDNSMFLQRVEDENGNPSTVVTNPSGLEDYIFSLDLPEADTKKLYRRYGLKWGD